MKYYWFTIYRQSHLNPEVMKKNLWLKNLYAKEASRTAPGDDGQYHKEDEDPIWQTEDGC